MARLDYKTDQGQAADDRLNPAEGLRQREEQARYNREFGDIANNFDKTADASQENANIEDARGREQAGSGFKADLDSFRSAAVAAANKATGGKFKFTFQKAAPIGGIVGGIGGVGIFLLASPLGMPILSMGQQQTDARANASRVQTVRYKSVLRYTVGNEKVAAACAKSVSSPACKFGTMSKTSKAQYEAAGFKVDGEEVGSRFLVKSMTAPDGTVIKDGDSMVRKFVNDIKFARSVRLAHNAGTLVMNGGNFLKKVLPNFGLNKTSVPEIPKEKKSQRGAINKLFGRSEDGKVSESELRSRIEQEARSKLGSDEDISSRANIDTEVKVGGNVKLAKGLAAIPGVLCLAYNTSNLIVNVAKIERVYYLAQIASPFLKLYSMIRNSENEKVPENTVAALAGQLTTPSEDPETEGLTAFDSQGVKLVFGSNERGLQEYTKNFLLHDNDILRTLNSAMDTINTTFHGKAKEALRTTCRAVNSWQGQLIGTAACAAIAAVQAGGGAAGGTVVPIIGNLVGGVAGGVAGLVECAAIVLGSFVIGKLISYVITEYIIPQAMEAAVEGLPTADTVGPPLGDAVTVGAAAVLNMGNRTNALLPSNGPSLKSFNDGTRESDELTKQIEIADARDTPFDIYNRYSFLGSIVSAMNTSVFTSESRMNSGNFSIQRLFGSFSLAPSALAIAESPSSIGPDDLSKDNCQDSALKSMGAECDAMGILSYGMSSEAMNMDIDPNITYMTEHKYIDENGAPIPDTDYAKVVTYCFERKTDIGVTTEAIEFPDYDWATGKNCYYDPNNKEEKEKFDNWQAYYSIMVANQDADQTEGQGGGGGGTGLNVMSYNILGASHSNDGGQSTSTRMNNLNKTIQAEQPDVVGFQEVSGTRDDVHDMLSGTYEGWPYDGEGAKDAASRPIYWNKTKFTAVEKEVFTTKRYSADPARFPYVKLKDNKSQKEFYVFNIHTSANSYKTPGYTSPEARAMQTKDMIKAIQSKAGYSEASKTYQTPVFTTGDYNSTCEKTGHDGSIAEDQIPCKLMYAAGFLNAGIEAYKASKSGAMVASIGQNQSNTPVTVTNYEYNTSHGSAGSARKKKASGEGRHIDHVFYTPQATVASWKNVITPETKSTSDHTPVVAKLLIAGIGDDDSAVSGEFSYPFGEESYQRNPAGYLRPHTAIGSQGPTGTAWGRPISISGAPTNKGPGIAADIGASAGRPVKAMFGGVVKSVNLCGAGDGVAIVSNMGGGQLYTAYMHGTNQRVKVDDTVKAGDTIMDVGMIGCNVFGAHLHVGMAWKTSSDANAKYICPQDVFVAAGQSLNFSDLVSKGKASCGGRQAKIL